MSSSSSRFPCSCSRSAFFTVHFNFYWYRWVLLLVWLGWRCRWFSRMEWFFIAFNSSWSYYYYLLTIWTGFNSILQPIEQTNSIETNPSISNDPSIAISVFSFSTFFSFIIFCLQIHQWLYMNYLLNWLKFFSVTKIGWIWLRSVTSTRVFHIILNRFLHVGFVRLLLFMTYTHLKLWSHVHK